MRWILILSCFVWAAGCSLLDRQGDPQILEVRTDRGSDTTVGRGHEVEITLVTDDPDSDELDFRWISSGGHFQASRRDTLMDLFQDSVKVVWIAPEAVGDYELSVEVSDGKSGAIATSVIRITVTQEPPVANAGPNRLLAYLDALRVVLDGTGSSDPDGDTLRYKWEQIGGPQVVFSEGSASPEFPAIAPADYVFALWVSDDVATPNGAVTSEPDTVVVRVSDREGRGP